MAESIRCPHSGRAYVMKPELAGKQVRCRQCQKTFAVPAVPLVVEEEPVVLSLAPEAAPASPGSSPNLLGQNWASGPALGTPGQEEALAVGSVLPLHGQTALGSVPSRRHSPASPTFWQRLQERKLTTTVAVVSLGLLLVSILLLFVGLPFLFVLPSLTGVGLAGLGLWLPAPKRRNRRGDWLAPVAKRIALGSGVIGVILAVLLVIFLVLGHSLMAAGMTEVTAVIIVAALFWATGLCFATFVLTIVVSILWSFVSKYGFMPVANSLYLLGSPLILLVLCVCAAVSRGLNHDHNFAGQPPAQSMNRDTGMPPGWQPDRMPPNQMPRTQMPPAASQMPMGPGGMPSMGPNSFPPGFVNPNDPEFYRQNLANLKSSDVNRRRIAVMCLAHAEPKELREEITKALEPLVNDSDMFVKAGSLRALGVWSTGDVVPIAIRALRDSDTMVRDSAIEILMQHKDSRAVEPLVALLSDPMNMAAARCLEEMGPTVEDAVLARYDSGNADAKRQMIQILGAVATQKGIAKLRQIAADKSDSMSASAARNALYRRGERITD